MICYSRDQLSSRVSLPRPSFAAALANGCLRYVYGGHGMVCTEYTVYASIKLRPSRSPCHFHVPAVPARPSYSQAGHPQRSFHPQEVCCPYGCAKLSGTAYCYRSCLFVCGSVTRYRLTSALTSMSPLSVRRASTGYVNFGVLGVHSIQNRRPHSSTHSSLRASTTAMPSWQARRRRRPTSCNEC